VSVAGGEFVAESPSHVLGGAGEFNEFLFVVGGAFAVLEGISVVGVKEVLAEFVEPHVVLVSSRSRPTQTEPQPGVVNV
jgi:hypothetical protein